jgi:hypothetical protein
LKKNIKTKKNNKKKTILKKKKKQNMQSPKTKKMWGENGNKIQKNQNKKK